MTRLRRLGLTAAALAVTTLTTLQAARVGEPAPDFAVKDTKGKEHTLASLKGKFVVLEWHNQGCPYVKKHYESGNMQALQKEWTGKGVVWLTVISSAPGLQGYVTAPEADAYVKEKGAAPTAVLLDPAGTMGRAYDSKTSPHMFIIDPGGRLGVQRRHRRQAHGGPGGPRGREELRVGGARRSHGGEGRDDAHDAAVRLLGQVRDAEHVGRPTQAKGQRSKARG